MRQESRTQEKTELEQIQIQTAKAIAGFEAAKADFEAAMTELRRLLNK